MFPGRYSEIFGLGERPGCILNLGHSFDAIEAYRYLLVCRYTLARSNCILPTIAGQTKSRVGRLITRRHYLTYYIRAAPRGPR